MVMEESYSGISLRINVLAFKNLSLFSTLALHFGHRSSNNPREDWSWCPFTLFKMAAKLGRLAVNNTAFLLCDIQEKFRPSIRYFPEIIRVAQRMAAAANILKIPVIATEQYPKGLGNTVQEIDTSPFKDRVFSKTKFSMVIPEVEEQLRQLNVENIVLMGIETQVCVLQTTMDLLERNFNVHVLADGVSSRTMVERMFALERIRQIGGFVTTSECTLFMLMGDAKHPNFREVQALVKTAAPDSGLLSKC